MPSYARQFAGGFRRPDVLQIDGLGPAIAVGQNVNAGSPRSTVGTITEVWDLLRLLYARLGEASPGVTLSRGLFAWNGQGACPSCQGLGLEDRLDPELLVADVAKSLRQGALRVSTPNSYLMYSQVTLAVLDEPSSGLHAADVATLVAAFERLCTSGQTLLVADHDLGLVRAAGRITDLGPGSGPDWGERGGRIVRTGAP